MSQAVLSEEPLAARRSAVLDNWAEALQTACNTLSRVPVQAMTSISVAGRLKGDSEEARLLRRLSREIAGEYGFTELVNLEGTVLSVRFSRTISA